jgi:hypothetical protein
MFIVSSAGVLLSRQTHVYAELSRQTHVYAELARVLLSGVCVWLVCVWLVCVLPVTTSGVLLSFAGVLLSTTSSSLPLL